MEKKTINLNGISPIQLVEDEDEIMEEVAKLYSENYIKSLKVHDFKHYQDLVSRYRIFKTHDGYVFGYEFNKPNIQRAIHYDDETEAPTVNFENFREYNTKYSWLGVFESYKEHRDLWILKDKQYGTYLFGRPSELHYELIRKLTPSEIDFIFTVYQAEREKYEKRLQTYWKRYSHKVYINGYWANR